MDAFGQHGRTAGNSGNHELHNGNGDAGTGHAINRQLGVRHRGMRVRIVRWRGSSHAPQDPASRRSCGSSECRAPSDIY